MIRDELVKVKFASRVSMIVSTEPPPMRVSTPAPPVNRSLPSPPNKESLPKPPISTSSPSPPDIFATPENPLASMRLSLASPSRRAAWILARVLTFFMPGVVVTTVIGVAPPPTRLLVVVKRVTGRPARLLTNSTIQAPEVPLTIISSGPRARRFVRAAWKASKMAFQAMSVVVSPSNVILNVPPVTPAASVTV